MKVEDKLDMTDQRTIDRSHNLQEATKCKEEETFESLILNSSAVDDTVLRKSR